MDPSPRVLEKLTNDPDGFAEFVQLVSLAVPSPSGSHSVTVLMTRQEFEASPLQKGALVRYSPHDAAHEAITYPDPAKQAYWVLVGCVAQLCAPGDDACRHRYRAGIYDQSTGVELKIGTDEPISGGVIINPLTLLPEPQTLL